MWSQSENGSTWRRPISPHDAFYISSILEYTIHGYLRELEIVAFVLAHSGERAIANCKCVWSSSHLHVFGGKNVILQAPMDPWNSTEYMQKAITEKALLCLVCLYDLPSCRTSTKGSWHVVRFPHPPYGTVEGTPNLFSLFVVELEGMIEAQQKADTLYPIFQLTMWYENAARSVR